MSTRRDWQFLAMKSLPKDAASVQTLPVSTAFRWLEGRSDNIGFKPFGPVLADKRFMEWNDHQSVVATPPHNVPTTSTSVATGIVNPKRDHPDRHQPTPPTVAFLMTIATSNCVGIHSRLGLTIHELRFPGRRRAHQPVLFLCRSRLPTAKPNQVKRRLRKHTRLSRSTRMHAHLGEDSNLYAVSPSSPISPSAYRNS